MYTLSHKQHLQQTSQTMKLSLKMAYTSHVNINVNVCQRAHYSTHNEPWHPESMSGTCISDVAHTYQLHCNPLKTEELVIHWNELWVTISLTCILIDCTAILELFVMISRSFAFSPDLFSDLVNL